MIAMGDTKVNTGTLVHKGCSVSGWASGQALDCEDAIDFAQLHGIKCMIEKFPLAKANDAWEHLMGGHPRFRCVLTMD